MSKYPTSFSEAILEPQKILDTTVPEEVLGKGSFGQVSKVPSAKNANEMFAVKRLNCGFEDDRAILTFLREIETQLILNDPEFSIFRGFHIPSVDDEEYKHPMLFMDYMENGNLLNCLHRLDQTQRAIVIYGVAVMMEYMHMKDVVHRDLKPENILLTKSMEPRISDFGSARTIASKMSAEVGTPIYQAPELTDVSGPSDKIRMGGFGCEVDVFSFGLIVWHILNNEIPYLRRLGHSAFPKNDLHRLKEEGFMPEGDVDLSGNMLRIISKCINPDAKQRPTAKEVRIELEECNIDDYGKGVDANRYKAYVKKMQAFLKRHEVA